MNIKEQIGWVPQKGDDLSPYMRPIKPPLETSSLVFDLLVGDERTGKTRKTHTTGDFSFLLSYKNIPAFVSSFTIENDALLLEQLQGIRGRADFRVATGVDCIALMAHSAQEVGQKLSLARLIMPTPWAVPGVSEEIKGYSSVLSKYYTFASIAGLALVDGKYVGIIGNP